MGGALRLEQAGGRALRLGQTWEGAAWETAHLGSCHLISFKENILTNFHPPDNG